MPDNLHITDKAGKDWSVTDIPSELMESFAVAAGEMYPGVDNPWMHFLLDSIASVCDTDRAVFQMTDIPVPAIEGLEAAATECHYTRFSLFSVILQAAAANNLVIGRLHTPDSAPGESVSLIITGVPVKSWEALENASKVVDLKLFGINQPSAMGILMLMFEFALKQGFTITHAPPSAPFEAAKTETGKGDATKRRPTNKRAGRFSGA